MERRRGRDTDKERGREGEELKRMEKKEQSNSAGFVPCLSVLWPQGDLRDRQANTGAQIRGRTRRVRSFVLCGVVWRAEATVLHGESTRIKDLLGGREGNEEPTSNEFTRNLAVA